ncbi:acyltransferase [Aliamphritea spongicola]|uniref:acyltransferase n=1 Tax=Aliamphritea spongicola TaxID=707589 RepID=UPI00196AD2F8|nr:acyltransferase [Aliamphritea spongicola]MBN3560859.1 acyltransferase [Aliamphritea spongicola]
MNTLHNVKRWVKTTRHPLGAAIRGLHTGWREFEVPALSPVYKPLRLLHQALNQLASETARILYWTPMFRTRLRHGPQGLGNQLYLFGGMPLVQGNLIIEMGRHCRLSGQTTFSGRWRSEQTPMLIVGNNVGISWQTTIAVGSKVVLGDNVRMGGRCFLAGYPGHPLDPVARAKGLPDTDDQVGDIILEQDVWLGSGVTVMKGVTIGAGTVVATASVVTHDLPAGVIAGGMPAKVIKAISCPEQAAAEKEALLRKESRTESREQLLTEEDVA